MLTYADVCIPQLLGTSFLYESPASYVTDQPNFVNAVCKISTNLEPLSLLAKLKEAEQSVGRQVTEHTLPESESTSNFSNRVPVISEYQ
jgi:2-amino-4-hydroxy-6-hydroxymethyldihydropteridine diphosphokinase